MALSCEMQSVVLRGQVLRSRLQYSKHGEYSGLFDVFRKTLQHDGVSGFWLGFRINLVRTIPQTVRLNPLMASAAAASSQLSLPSGGYLYCLRDHVEEDSEISCRHLSKERTSCERDRKQHSTSEHVASLMELRSRHPQALPAFLNILRCWHLASMKLLCYLL